MISADWKLFPKRRILFFRDESMTHSVLERLDNYTYIHSFFHIKYGGQLHSFIRPSRSDLWEKCTRKRQLRDWKEKMWDVMTLYFVRSNILHTSRRSTNAWKRRRSNAMAATEFRSSRVRLYISIKSVPAQSACGRPHLRRPRRTVRNLGRGVYKEFDKK